MAKQTIDLGTSPNKGDGDPLRTAFDKVNNNFDELYAQAASDIVLSSINASLIPDTDVAYDLGSASNRFRDIYLSGSTIDLGGLEISNVGGELKLDGVKLITQSELDVAVQNDITTNLTGSVFADDSTLLVDGVAGRIVGVIENTAITTSTITGSSNLTMVGANRDTDGGTVVVVGGIGNGGDGGDITLAAGIGSAGVGGEITVAGGIGSTDGGEITIIGGIGSAGEGGQVDIRGGSGGTDGGDVTIYAGVGGTGNGVINIGTFTTSAVNIDNAVITGDLTGSVFADDSTLLVDGVNGVIPWSVISDVDLDALVAGEGIPDLLTAYTDQSAVVDSLLNAGDYGGDLVAPSDYTFYDLVVARRAVNPLIPQDLEDEALAQLNAYNAWQAEIAADKATITVGDYAWEFKGDGNIDGLFEGTGPVSFNNDFLEDGFRGGFTTDKSILQINGADYLNGSDDGGGIIISAGAARNGGNNGDIIISSGGGGAAGTGHISLLADAGISTSGNWIGTQTMDIKGSVFGDDSTTVVDGINGNVTANILTSNTASNFNGTLSVVGVTRLYDDLIIDGGDIVSENSAYFFGNLECSNITNLQNNAFASDNLTLSAEGSIVLNGNVSLGTVAGRSDFYGEIEFNSGTTLFQAANSVEFNGPVDFTNATFTGEPWISVADLKTLVAASTDFADFQTRIAAL